MSTRIGWGVASDCSEFIWNFSLTFFVHIAACLTRHFPLEFVGDMDGFARQQHIWSIQMYLF